MKNFRKIIATFVTLITLFTITPIVAHAEWKSNSTGWWYAEGSSWANGWRQIDGNWYYFYSDGYMATDTTIDGYYLNSNGAWTTSAAANTSTNNISNSGGSTNDQSQTVYVSDKGIYHKSSNAHGMKSYTTMSLQEAQEKGYKACESCYK